MEKFTFILIIFLLSLSIVVAEEISKETRELYVRVLDLIEENIPNNPEVEDPHWIFPGQVLTFVFEDGFEYIHEVIWGDTEWHIILDNIPGLEKEHGWVKEVLIPGEEELDLDFESEFELELEEESELIEDSAIPEESNELSGSSNVQSFKKNWAFHTILLIGMGLICILINLWLHFIPGKGFISNFIALLIMIGLVAMYLNLRQHSLFLYGVYLFVVIIFVLFSSVIYHFIEQRKLKRSFFEIFLGVLNIFWTSFNKLKYVHVISPNKTFGYSLEKDRLAENIILFCIRVLPYNLIFFGLTFGFEIFTGKIGLLLTLTFVLFWIAVAGQFAAEYLIIFPNPKEE